MRPCGARGVCGAVRGRTQRLPLRHALCSERGRRGWCTQRHTLLVTPRRRSRRIPGGCDSEARSKRGGVQISVDELKNSYAPLHSPTCTNVLSDRPAVRHGHNGIRTIAGGTIQPSTHHTVTGTGVRARYATLPSESIRETTCRASWRHALRTGHVAVFAAYVHSARVWRP